MHLKVRKETNHNNPQNPDPEPPLTLQTNPLTTRTVPQPMRPGPDLGMPPEVEPEQDNGQWQVPGQGSAAKFGPSQDHPILPKERTLKAET